MTEYNKKLIQQQFSQNPEGYVTSTVHAKGYSLQRLAELVDPQPDWRILDIATGGGHTALKFAPLVKQTFAADLTFSMLQKAREHLTGKGFPDAGYIQCEAEHLPFAAETFNLITCRIAPHHFPDILAFIEAVTRILVPGGIFALADNMVSGEPEIANYVNTFERLRDRSHVWAYSEDDWLAFYVSAGLKVIHSEVFTKELEFNEWAVRMGVAGDDLTRLRVMLVRSPDRVREFFQPRETGQNLIFSIREGIVIGQKQ